MDNRYRFVRGKPFDGLEDYKKKTIHVENHAAIFPLQLKMFEQISQSDKKISNEIHNFYRHVGELIYGDSLIPINYSNGNLIYPDAVRGRI